jgi:hypothetical protein
MSRAWWVNRELVTSGLVAGEVGELPVLGNLVPSRLEQLGAVWSTEGARESGSGGSCRPPQSMLIGQILAPTAGFEPALPPPEGEIR